VTDETKSVHQYPKSLYRRLVEAGLKTDHHEADLYVERTEASLAIIEQFKDEGGLVSPATFVSQVERTPWIDLPFQYDPFWEAKQKIADGVAEYRAAQAAARSEEPEQDGTGRTP
jgi:hypothetical protein